MRANQFIRPGLEVRYLVAERVEDVIPMLRDAARRAEREGLTESHVIDRL